MSLVPPSSATHSTGVGGTILLVEDDQGLAQMLAWNLGRFGASVIHAATLEEGLRYLRETAPLAILCDLDLPDGSGLGFIRSLRTRGSSVPVIAMTGMADWEFFSIAARQAGASQLLAKPFDQHSLGQALSRALGRPVSARSASEPLLLPPSR